MYLTLCHAHSDTKGPWFCVLGQKHRNTHELMAQKAGREEGKERKAKLRQPALQQSIPQLQERS